MQLAACPDHDQLSAFLLGKLRDDTWHQIAAHTSDCPDCRRLLQGLDEDAADSLVLAIRLDPPAAPLPELAALLKKVEAIGSCLGLPLQPVPAVSQDYRQVLSPPQAPDELGRLGPYRVLKVLGQGGMGVVFHAEDLTLRRAVALKVMRPGVVSDAAAKERFLREARATAAIEHDHIVAIHQVGEDRGVPYLAMQLLRGLSLEDYLRQTPESGPSLTTETILHLAQEIMCGLAAAHAHGLIHRDIKPANIWLEPSAELGGRTAELSASCALRAPSSALGRVKILDFGLARPVMADAQITQSGMIIGTPAYMAPEQARGEPIDVRADLFSLGCVLYRLCTGRLPWKEKDAVSTLIAVATKEPAPIAQLNPAVPYALAELVERLLAKQPEDRPSSAQAVIDELQTIAHDVRKEDDPQRTTDRSISGSGAQPQSLDGSTRPRPLPHVFTAAWRRHPVVVAALALLAVTGLVAGGIVYVQTDTGTLKIETADDQVQVIVEQGGNIVKTLDRATGAEVVLHSGEYRLRLGAGRKDIRLSHERIEIVRGEQTVASITRVERLPDAPARAGVEEAWVKRVSEYLPKKQVAAVLHKLQQLNPGFDAQTARSVIQNDHVTELSIVGYYVTDVSPVRALKHLQKFACNQPPHWAEGLSNLSPLRGLSLRSLECRGTAVRDLSPLQGMALKRLDVGSTPVEDLRPLQKVPLEELAIENTRVTDLSPLRLLPLKELSCDYRPERDTAALRSIKTLRTVNGLAVEWLFFGDPDKQPILEPR